MERGPLNTRMHGFTPELSLNVQAATCSPQRTCCSRRQPPALALTPVRPSWRACMCVLGGTAHETDCKALDRDALSCDLALTSLFPLAQTEQAARPPSSGGCQGGPSPGPTPCLGGALQSRTPLRAPEGLMSGIGLTWRWQLGGGPGDTFLIGSDLNL